MSGGEVAMAKQTTFTIPERVGDAPEINYGEPTAVMDAIGVDPDYRDRGIGNALLSQLIVNLRTLRVERIRTEVDWGDQELLSYLERFDFAPSQQLCLDLGL